jgi:formylglycine-generating enzyme required for sulfatase activity
MTFRRLCLLATLVSSCAASQLTSDPADARNTACGGDMAYVDASDQLHAYCIDRWEASLVDIQNGRETAHSPFDSVTQGQKVRAVSRSGVMPQAYISRDEADQACKASKKRLCKDDEWIHACEGKRPTTFPYGDDHHDGYCNDSGKAPVDILHHDMGEAAYASFQAMNDPQLNQVPGTLARTGAHPHCKSSYGTFDMVGNLHEWTEDPNGTFRGGYYRDTHLNGDGCKYKTVAHAASYHDYSTGFRCCSDTR